MNRHALTAAVLLTALVGCTAEDGSTPAKVATTTTRTAGPETLQLGQSVTITRTDTGGKVGTIRFTGAEVAPAECVPYAESPITLAVRVEIENGAGEQLPVPNTYQLQYLDGRGSTRPVAVAVLDDCESQYPEASTAPVGGATDGWLVVGIESEPAELVYTPMVGDQTSTAANIKILAVTPSSVRVDVPDHMAGPAATTAEDDPEPEPTTRAPATTTAARPATPVAPPTGRDSQGRPNGSGGELVGCAGEGYQPGTGIYADGSKGFAKECLHQGN